MWSSFESAPSELCLVRCLRMSLVTHHYSLPCVVGEVRLQWLAHSSGWYRCETFLVASRRQPVPKQGPACISAASTLVISGASGRFSLGVQQCFHAPVLTACGEWSNEDICMLVSCPFSPALLARFPVGAAAAGLLHQLQGHRCCRGRGLLLCAVAKLMRCAAFHRSAAVGKSACYSRCTNTAGVDLDVDHVTFSPATRCQVTPTVLELAVHFCFQQCM